MRSDEDVEESARLCEWRGARLTYSESSSDESGEVQVAKEKL